MYLKGFVLLNTVGIQKEGSLLLGNGCCPLKELHTFPWKIKRKLLFERSSTLCCTGLFDQNQNLSSFLILELPKPKLKPKTKKPKLWGECFGLRSKDVFVSPVFSCFFSWFWIFKNKKTDFLFFQATNQKQKPQKQKFWGQQATNQNQKPKSSFCFLFFRKTKNPNLDFGFGFGFWKTKKH